MINVVCAVIHDEQGRMLACQRSSDQSMAGKWEFPGGKVEAGEDEAQALIREMEEELACKIQVGDRLSPVEHDYPDFSIRLIPYRCHIVENAPLKLLEHAAIRWLMPEQCALLDWAEADIPIWQELLSQG